MNKVALILAVSAGTSVVLLTVAALIAAAKYPGHQLSAEYATLLTGTLGVLVGSLSGLLGRDRPAKPDDPRDDDTLHLSGGDVIALDASTGVQASDAARTVTALVIPWGQTGHTTAGPLNVTRGGVRLPADLARCKLYSDHTGTPQHRPVGHALAYHVDDAGLHMTFSVARTPDGDAAIVDIRERVRDAVSAELAGIKRQGNTVTDSIMTGVALVSTPAFSDARVTDVHAQHTETEGTPPMNPEQYLRAMIAAGAAEAEARASAVVRFGQAAVDAVPTGITATPPVPAESTPPAATPPAPAPGAHADAAAASYTPPRAAVVPFGVPGGDQAHAQRTQSAYEAAQIVHMIASGRSAEVAHAELTNITNSGLVDATPPEWLGELWSGPAKTRKLIPLMNRRDLRSWLIRGFTWVNKPLVASYAGDKAEIPTNAVSVAPYEAEAVRWAGGHDLDRKFFDFGDAAILESYWRAMNESYAVVTDNAAGTWLVANATTLVDAAATDLIRAMIALGAAVDDATGVGPSYYLGNPADKYSLLSVTNDNLSAFFDMFGVDPRAIKWTSQVPAGTLVAGAKPAATWHELPGSPLRVEAEHLSHGGRDRAMFGYSALTLDQPDGLRKIVFDAP